MKFNLNFFILCIFSLSNGDFRGVGADFDFYYNRLIYIKEFNIPLSDWFSSSIENYKDTNLPRISNWVPSPFYSIIFLGPLLIHNSDLLFALQGILIIYLTYRIIRKHLKEIYYLLDKNILNLMMIIGSLNPAFLKDYLTSGPVAVCNLFILYGLFYKNNLFLSSVFFAFAAMSRSSYIIYWLLMLISCLLVDKYLLKKFFKITSLSLFIYIIFFIFFYSSQPGSQLSMIWMSGLKGISYYEEFFIRELSRYYEVFDQIDILNLNISFIELLNLILTDFKIAYGTFVSWIFKILSSLGFLHSNLFWDMRSIYIQRILTIIYFIFVLGPAFVFSSFSLFAFWKDPDFWFKKEKLILTFAVLFLLIHSLIMGLPRYMTLVHWIFTIFSIRFIYWIKEMKKQNFYKNNVKISN